MSEFSKGAYLAGAVGTAQAVSPAALEPKTGVAEQDLATCGARAGSPRFDATVFAATVFQKIQS